MKRCSACQRGYSDATEFCLDDGQPLDALEVRTVADLLGAQHPPARVSALLAAAAEALGRFELARLSGALYPEDLELAADAPDAPRVLIAVDLEARRRDDPVGLARRAAVQTPESLRGEPSPSDEAAVVYGLGCIGYALSEGCFAFEAASPAASRVRKLLEAPPRAVHADGLAQRLLDAMSPDALARPALARFTAPLDASPVALAAPAPSLAAPAPQALAPQRDRSPSPIASKPRSARRGVLALLGGGVIAALSVTAALMLQTGQRASVPAPAPLPSTPSASVPTVAAPVPVAEPVGVPEPAPVTPPLPLVTVTEAPRRPSGRSRSGARAPRPPAALPRSGAASPGGLNDLFGVQGVGGGGGGESLRSRAASSEREPLRRSRIARSAPVIAAPEPPAEAAPQAATPAPAPTAPPTSIESARGTEGISPRDGRASTPAARVVRAPERSLLPWVLIGSGSLLGALLGIAGIVSLRRRRAPERTRPELTRPRDLPEAAGFAQTVAQSPPAPPPSSVRCVSCSRVVPAEARFCPYDGAPVTGASGPSPVQSHVPLPQRFCVGPYECIEPLGEGGMGVVYRARHLQLDRVAAVKVLLPGAGLDPSRVELFRREARLAASVQHKNSVAIYDFGELQGAMLYLAMELVEGQSLEQLIEGRPMSPPRVARIVRQIGDGLDAAHRAGVIHRDLKPANVMVCDGPEDLVKIVDFGIARGVMDPRRTEAGRVMGTLGYMAPEQARGDVDLDARADVFALGVVAYEMLTGALPFDDRESGFHVALMRRMALHGAPPAVSARVSSLGPSVDECLRAALDPLRERRTATAGAFARSLEAALAGAPSYASMRVG